MNQIINYKITRYSDNLSKTELEECVRRGFELWEKHTDLKFIQVNEHQNLTLEFVKDHPKFSDMQVQAFTDSPDFIMFNDKVFWSKHGEPVQIRNEFGQSIRVKTAILPRIVAHEFGHVMGLDHSNEPYDLMSYPIDPNTFEFSENDLKRIGELI